MSIIIRNDKANFDPLKPFAGTIAIIDYLAGDIETKRSAGAIAGTIHQAGWKVQSLLPREDDVRGDGVTVMHHLAPYPNFSDAKVAADEERTRSAAYALADYLIANSWIAVAEAAPRRFEGQSVPPNTVRVWVGAKPIPYFDSSIRTRFDNWQEIRNVLDDARRGVFRRPRTR